VKHIGCYLFGQSYSRFRNSFVIICSGNFAWSRWCGLLQMRARTWMRSAPAQCGTQAGGSNIRSAVAMSGKCLPVRSRGAGRILMRSVERRQLTVRQPPCLVRCRDVACQTTLLLPPGLSRQLLLLLRNWLSVVMCWGRTGPSWYGCCSVFLALDAASLSWCRLEWFLQMCLLLDADVERMNISQAKPISGWKRGLIYRILAVRPALHWLVGRFGRRG